MTHTEHTEAARQAWEQAEATLNKLGKQMDKLINKRTPVDTMQYNLECDQIELIRAQYAAIAPLVKERWDAYQEMTNQTA
jgi:enamine deaminase RidA (YjgF/YER057c/UK114 family)